LREEELTFDSDEGKDFLGLMQRRRCKKSEFFPDMELELKKDVNH